MPRSQMPHKRTLDEVAGVAAALRDAIEDERRLAYVALTRTKHRFVALHSSGQASQFLQEAGLVEDSAAPAMVPSRAPGGRDKVATRQDYCPQCGKSILLGQRIVLPRGWRIWIHDGC